MKPLNNSGARPIGRARRRSRAGVEGLESRRLLSATYEAFPLASQYSQPGQIVVGPDHNLWFTDIESVLQDGVAIKVGAISMINPTTGAIVEHPTGVMGSAPTGLTFTPDGNIWFADPGNHAIGLFNPVTGYLIEFATPLPGGTPQRVTLGPDGNVWFTDDAASAIGEINPTTHAIDEYPLPRSDEGPEGIVSGPDDNLWFTEGSIGSIGSISPTTHTIAEYALPNVTGPLPGGSRVSAREMTLGPDNKFWFTADAFQRGGPLQLIGQFDPTSHSASYYYPLSNPRFLGGGITSGPQGEIWFLFGQINPTTQLVTTDSVPPAVVSTPTNGGIVEGPDGNVWSVRTGQVVKATPIPANESFISGTVVRDPIVGPGTLSAQTVYIDLNHDGKLDPGDPSAVADSNGNYTLGPITPGTVTLRVVGYPGNTVISPAGGSQSIVAGGGQIVQAAPISLATFGSTLPLTFNPTPFGAHNPDVQTAEVNGLYQLILGRAPDSVGGASAIAALKGGEPLYRLASGLLHSAEYFTDLAIADYENYLGRAPAGAEVKAVVSALQGGLGVETLAEDLLSSAEFNASHPTDASFVQAVYGDILGRMPSASESSAVEGLIAGGLSRASVAQAVVGSSEAANLLVANVYGVFLDRAGDSPGVSFWAGGLQAGVDPLDVAAEFASSAEFAQRANSTVG